MVDELIEPIPTSRLRNDGPWIGREDQKPNSTMIEHVYLERDPAVDEEAARKAYVDSQLSTTLPSGIICMWSGASDAVPTGWALCNGSNGTPDLRDRFLVGAGSSYAVGATGGETNHALIGAELASHGHVAGTLAASAGTSHVHSAGTLAADNESAHTHAITTRNGTSAGNYCQGFSWGTSSPGTFGSGTGSAHGHTISGTSAGESSHTHPISGTTGDAGSGTAHENRPPYYALCFIMKI